MLGREVAKARRQGPSLLGGGLYVAAQKLGDGDVERKGQVQQHPSRRPAPRTRLQLGNVGGRHLSSARQLGLVHLLVGSVPPQPLPEAVVRALRHTERYLAMAIGSRAACTVASELRRSLLFRKGNIMTKAPQSGILNRPAEHALLFAMHFLPGTDVAACRSGVEQLREVQRRELHSDIDEITAGTDKNVPFSETGELGYQDGFNRAFLTMTVGFSARAMERLGVPVDQRPTDLVEVPWADLGLAPTLADPGDVLVQLCSDSPFVGEHAQRRIEQTLAAVAETIWAVRGDQRFTSRQGRVNAGEARALIGFHDGTANLDPAHDEDHRRLVFVDPSPEAIADYPPTPAAGPQPPPQPGQPGYGSGGQGPIFPPMRPAPGKEPAWCEMGSYSFVQAITMDLGRWDRTALGAQEQSVGRFKRSGASLDLSDDDSLRREPPAFAANPALETVAIDSHVRKANPRAVPDDAKRRVFRRGYPLIVSDGTGPTRRGLLFQSFSRTTSTQIEFILKGWMFNRNFPRPDAGNDALAAFFSGTLCGGYYFVPGIARRTEPWSWVVPPAE